MVILYARGMIATIEKALRERDRILRQAEEESRGIHPLDERLHASNEVIQRELERIAQAGGAVDLQFFGPGANTTIWNESYAIADLVKANGGGEWRWRSPILDIAYDLLEPSLAVIHYGSKWRERQIYWDMLGGVKISLVPNPQRSARLQELVEDAVGITGCEVKVSEVWRDGQSLGYTSDVTVIMPRSYLETREVPRIWGRIPVLRMLPGATRTMRVNLDRPVYIDAYQEISRTGAVGYLSVDSLFYGFQGAVKEPSVRRAFDALEGLLFGQSDVSQTTVRPQLLKASQ